MPTTLFGNFRRQVQLFSLVDRRRKLMYYNVYVFYEHFSRLLGRACDEYIVA